jgi:hypothetical protein
MIARGDRQPIIIADAGPLLRLAAAGLLSALSSLNRRIVLVDRVRDEVVGDVSKPFAKDIAAWIDAAADAIQHERTAIGIGVATLENKSRTAEEDMILKSARRDSGELALREFLDRWRPTETGSALVIYEDRKVPSLFMSIEYPLTLVTTRTFARVIKSWGINADAISALEAVAQTYDLKPALIMEIDPAIPEDLRQLPRPFESGTP